MTAVVSQVEPPGAIEAGLPATAAIMSAYGRAPLFTTMAEFDAWMNDPLRRLTLDPNVAR